MDLSVCLQPYLPDDAATLDWELIETVDPTGALGVMLYDLPDQLRAFADHDQFRHYWRQLGDPRMLADVTAPMAAAMIHFYRSRPDPADLHANLQALITPLAAAARQYEPLHADLRTLRFAPLLLTHRVIGDAGGTPDADGNDPGDDLLTISQTLTSAFWMLLGVPAGTWARCFHARGISWGQAPADAAGRGALLLAAHQSGVPYFALSADLAAGFPDRADGWACPDPAAFAAQLALSGVTPDPRLSRWLRSMVSAQALGNRTRIEVDLAQHGWQDITFTAPVQLRAPLQEQGMPAIPWLLHGEQGVMQGGLVLAEDRDAMLAGGGIRPGTEQPLDGARRRVLRYAGLADMSCAGQSEALIGLLLTVLTDLQNPDLGWETGPSRQESDPRSSRQARRQLTRERESGRGAVRVHAGAGGALSMMREQQTAGTRA